jgi:hypothetical protein
MIVFDHVHLAAFLMFSTSARQSSVPKKNCILAVMWPIVQEEL